MLSIPHSRIGVIIPYHDEPAEATQNLLSAFEAQQNINYISDIHYYFARSDGILAFPDLTAYPTVRNNSSLLSKKMVKCGPGQSRQVALEVCNCDYLMFCDCDDTLANEHSLSMLLQEATGEDIIAFPYYRVLNGIDSLFINRPWEIWTALYKVDFLKKYKIHFAMNVYRSEDALFTIMCDSIKAGRVKYATNPYYKYLIRSDSVSQSSYDNLTTQFNNTKEFITYYENWYSSINLNEITNEEFVEFIFITIEDLLMQSEKLYEGALSYPQLKYLAFIINKYKSSNYYKDCYNDFPRISQLIIY